MPEERKFEYDSIQDAQTIKESLQALVTGFEKGELSLKSEDEEIVLEPRGLLRLRIKAKQQADRNKLSLKISWRTPKPDKSGESISIE
jgi:amphi-Trp domain-containing protein